MSLFNSFRFEIVNKKQIKIHYTGKENISVIIGFQLVGFLTQNYFHRHTFSPRTWTVPNYDLLGVEKIVIYEEGSKNYLFEWLVPKLNVIKDQNPKIICLGLNKTGTTSFQKGLENLGINFFPHLRSMVDFVPSYHHGNIFPILSILQNPKYRAFGDMPFSFPSFYKHIYEHRPNDIYVLTIRESTEKWVKSFKQYHEWLLKNANEKSINNHPSTLSVENVVSKTHLKNFISPLFDEYGLFENKPEDSYLSEIYENYNNEVIEFFRNKPNSNFMVLDVSKPGELKKFSDWLGISNSEMDFPWENKTK